MDDRTIPRPDDRDPVCDMVVDLEQAEEHGLTLMHASVAYGFCSKACPELFARDAAMSFSSVSVVGNALRLRSAKV